jgi:creatinine amidohydrolase
VSRWEFLTSPELGALDRDIPVVLPISAVEQHGPHLPVGTDHLIGDHLVAAAEAALGEEVLVLPGIAAGCSDHHLDFPGTLSLRHTTLLNHVEDVANTVLGQGFTTLVLFNAHGGNQGIGQVALERIGAAHRRARVVFTSWWRLAGPELLNITESGPGGVGHACELETSIMLAIAPELVRTDQAPARTNTVALGYDDSDMLRGSRASLYRRMSQVSGSGVFGSPQAASAAKGHAAVAAIVDQLAGLVRELRDSRVLNAGVTAELVP